jgi:hypothetical protein
VPVRVRHPEPADGISLEVELDQHRRLISYYPPVVPRLDRDDRGCHKLHRAAIRVLNVDLAARQEADVGVHAEIRTDDGFHVGGPAKARRTDHTLDATGAGSSHINLGTTDLATFGAGYGCAQWIVAIHEILHADFSAAVEFYQTLPARIESNRARSS